MGVSAVFWKAVSWKQLLSLGLKFAVHFINMNRPKYDYISAKSERVTERHRVSSYG